MTQEIADNPPPPPIPESEPGRWSKFLAMTQAGPTRKKWTNNIIGAGDYVPIGVGAFALLAALQGLPTSTPWLVATGLLLTILGVFSKALKFGLDLREKAQKKTLEAELTTLQTSMAEKQREAAAEASFKVLEGWKTVARHHEDGMDNANRQLQEGMHFNPDERAETRALVSYLQAVISVFEVMYEGMEGKFSTNLVVPNGDGTELWLVMIEPGGKGRSNPLPRAINLAANVWGVGVAFNEKQIVYTEDVRTQGSPGDRGYLSVVNIPVMDSHGNVCALVNVDSPDLAAFGSIDAVSSAVDFCRPVLSSLSLCLNDVRLFREVRC